MVLALALGRGGKVLATAGPDEPVYLSDAATGRQLGQLEAPAAGVTPHLEFSADADKLLVDGGGRATLWSVSRGEALTRFEGHPGPIQAAALSPDGRLAATAGQDTTILIWDLTGARPAPRGFSPDYLERQ